MRFALSDNERLASNAARELFQELVDADRVAIPGRLKRSGWFEVVREGGPIIGLLAAEQAGWCGLAFPFSEQALAVPAAFVSYGAAGGGETLQSHLGQVAPVGMSALCDGLRGREPLTAAHDSTGWTVSGTAWPVIATSNVAFCLAVARCGEGDVNGLFVIPAGKRRPLRSLDPSVDAWRVDFVDAESLGDRLPYESLAALLEWGAAGAAAEMLGAAQRLLDMSVKHAKQRTQFGRPIGSFQAVKHHCATMHVLVETMRASVWGAAVALSSPGSAQAAISIAKSYCGPAAKRVARTALQVHGGIGFTAEHRLHHYLKRIERLAAEFGDARWHRIQMAQRSVPEIMQVGPTHGTNPS
jgi:alkylation response protein AidB-like acyl-CoA dehydrogenase